LSLEQGAAFFFFSDVDKPNFIFVYQMVTSCYRFGARKTQLQEQRFMITGGSD
jgi:hypothetical protein